MNLSGVPLLSRIKRRSVYRTAWLTIGATAIQLVAIVTPQHDQNTGQQVGVSLERFVDRSGEVPILLSTVIFITTTGSSSWSVPSDWNNVNNSIECIGGGGGGAGSANSTAGGGAGGGYSLVSNLALTRGASITVQVGASGAGGGASTNGSVGGDTWFNGANLAASSVGAKGGAGGQTNTGTAAGGASGSGVGSTKFSGGAGGTGAGSPNGGGSSGGGAGGPHRQFAATAQ
jgi:hypothetical protein